MANYSDAYGSPDLTGSFSGLGGVLGALGSIPMGLLRALYNQPGIPGGPPTGGQVEAGFPATNTMPPVLGMAPTPQQQQQPSQQPAGPQSNVGPPLNILAGADMSGNAELPANATPTQGFAPPQQPFPNPYDGGLIGRLQTALAPMNPQAYQAAISPRLAQAQFNALMQDPNMTPGRAIAMMQSPQILQNYYDTRQLGSVKNAAGEEVPVIASQGQVGPMGGGNGFMQGGMDAIRQKAAAQKLGETQGTAQGGLVNQQALFDKGLQDIDGLIKDPNLRLATGPAHLMGLDKFGPGAAAAAKVHQLAGEASIAGLSYLRGIGRLNINEFNAGTQAIARLNQAQNYNDMVSALRDLRETFALARTRAGEAAGVGPTPPQQQNAAQFSQDELAAEARRRGLIK